MMFLCKVEGIKFFLRSLARNILRSNKIKWFSVNFKARQILCINNLFIRDAEVIIANHWPTAFPVFHLNRSKGEKFYFIRDVEQWADFYNVEKQCFQLPMKRLVTTEFIKNFLLVEWFGNRT